MKSLQKTFQFGGATLLTLALLACGGGGGDSTSTSSSSSSSSAASVSSASSAASSQASSLSSSSDTSSSVSLSSSSAASSTSSAATSVNGSLIISEVGANPSSGDSAWFEVYNASAAAIDLSGYSVKTGRNGLASSLSTFTLPSYTLPAGGYAVVAGQTASWVNGLGKVYIGASSNLPYWGSSGSIDLIKNGATLETVDFVRFGASSNAPTTSPAWSGSNVSALPATYGVSLVRYGSAVSDTDTAADWTAVDFATPGGLNDVPAGATDADGDGIPDSAEAAGGTFAGMNLYAMGVRTGIKDILVEIDWMNTTDLGVIPQKAALDKVVAAFSASGKYAIHFDVGGLFGDAANSGYNWGGGNVLGYNQCIWLNPVIGGSSCDSTGAYLSTYKAGNMAVARRSIFHYMVFANSQNADGSGGSSGVAELYGNDVIISLGGWGLTSSGSTYKGVRYSATQNANLLNNFQAATVMHEIGHNFGLGHGGGEDANFKPNYFSIMNYLYQLNGLVPDPSAQEVMEPYYLEAKILVWGTRGYCNLTYGPCTNNFVIDYSNGSGASLNETALQESSLIGRGVASGAYADWNASGALNASTYALNINGDADGDITGSGTQSTLTDYDDWNNLVLPFASYYSGQNGVSLLKTTTSQKKRIAPMSNDVQEIAREYNHRRH